MYQPDKEKPLPSRDDLQKILIDCINISPRKKLVELLGAYDRVVAEDIFAERTLPTTFTYKEDGIAIDFSKQELLKTKGVLKEGEDYIHANQGWPVEEPFNTLLPLQDVELAAGQATIHKWAKLPQANISIPGEIMSKGDLLVPKYSVISGPIMGLLAMGGIQAVPVLARPRILFIPTGDELVDWQESRLEPGENIESNSVMVAGFAQKFRCKLEVMPIIPDEQDALIDALHYAKDLADLVIISAGTSKGNKDFTKKILGAEGTILVAETGFNPGRYLTVAKLGNTPILSLPGSPKGVALTLGICLPAIVNKYYKQRGATAELVKTIAEFQYTGDKNFDTCLELALTSDDKGNYHGQRLIGKNLTKGVNLAGKRGLYYLPRGERITLGEEILVELLP